MNAPSSSATERLLRLAGYVEQDSSNAALLAEACDAALACGQHGQAETYLAAGESHAPGSLEWPFRRARLCMLRGELRDAQALLERLRGDSGEHPAVLHDLAYVHLLLGEAGAAQTLLAPCIDQALPAGLADGLHALWLRACHQQGATAEALAWIRSKEQGDGLQGEAAGVASLIAWDEDEAAAAASLADAALSQTPGQREALITRGLIALAAHDPAAAMAPLRGALAGNPEDGRTLSSLGLAYLLAGDAEQAQLHLRKAATASPRHAQTLQALGWACMLTDDRAAALDALRSALALDGQAADVHASLALVHFMSGKQEDAATELQHAEAIDPQDQTTRLVRTLLAGQAGAAARDALLRQMLPQWRPRP